MDKAEFSVNRAWLVGFPWVTINFEHKEKQYPQLAAADRKEAKSQEYYHRTSNNEYALYPLTLQVSLKKNCIQDWWQSLPSWYQKPCQAFDLCRLPDSWCEKYKMSHLRNYSKLYSTAAKKHIQIFLINKQTNYKCKQEENTPCEPPTLNFPHHGIILEGRHADEENWMEVIYYSFIKEKRRWEIWLLVPLQGLLFTTILFDWRWRKWYQI